MNGETISRPCILEKLGGCGIIIALLLCLPAFAGDDITLAVGRPMVDETPGTAVFESDTWEEQQSAKAALAVGLEYRHWFTNRSGFQLDFNRTGTNATFADSFGSVRFAVTRYELSGAFTRHFGRSESKLHPFLNVGPGVLLFDGGYAPGGTVGWSAVPECVLAGGFDTPLSKHLSLRTAYRFHLFRNTNYGDAAFHAGFARIQEPMVGLSWNFDGIH